MGEGQLTNEEIVTLSSLMGRAMLARAMSGGFQFDGNRDMYAVLGYPKKIEFGDYLEKFLRQDIAGKVVDLPAQDTWRKPPKIIDGEEDSTMQNPKSDFLQAIQYLVEERRMWHYLQRVDRLSGIGQYGVLLIGARVEGALNTPLTSNLLKSASDVIYLACYSEGSATITNFVQDTTNERFGLPELYSIKLGEKLNTEAVHWSRTLHVAEDVLEDDVYGMPRLERVYNRLNDLLKLVGGGSEATWKNMDRGLHADIRDDHELDAIEAGKLGDEIDEYIHGLRRFIRTKGVDIESLGADVVDPTGLFNATVALIAAASDIPQRILLGSERGELASSQDQANWAAVIAARQTQHAEPNILRPFLKRLTWLGALPRPRAGKYQVEWASLFELNELEKARVADTYAGALQKVSGGAPELIVTPDEFRERVMGWPAMERNERDLLDDEEGMEEGIDDVTDDEVEQRR